MRLQLFMRLLREQHVYWTRMTIISIAHDLPELSPTTERLLRNNTDFEMAFGPFYGEAIANQFGSLIKGHLVIATELVKATKVGDNQKVCQRQSGDVHKGRQTKRILQGITLFLGECPWKQCKYGEYWALNASKARDLIKEKLCRVN